MFILIIPTPKETSPNNSRFMNLDIALVMVRFFDLKWEVARMVYYWLCCNNWINPHMQQTSYGSFWILMGQWYPQLVFDLWGSLGISGDSWFPETSQPPTSESSSNMTNRETWRCETSHANIYIYMVFSIKNNGVIDVFYGQTPTDTWHLHCTII